MVDRSDALTLPPPRSLPTGRSLWSILPVIAAQLLTLVWLLVVPLPSIEGQRLDAEARASAIGSGAPGGLPSLRRAYFLLAADDHLNRAFANLSEVEHLSQRVPIVLAALLIGGAAVSLGGLVLQGLGLNGMLPPLARLPLAFVSGSTLLAALLLMLGRSIGLAPWPTRISLGLLLLAGIVLRIVDRKSPAKAPQGGPDSVAASPTSRPRWAWVGLGLIVMPVLMLMTLGAMQPTIEYDALEYHLQGPKEYFEAGRISFLSHNVYTSMPSAVEMLHLLGMLVMGDWWLGALVGQLLIAGFAPATAALIGAAAYRWASARAAWVAVLVYLTTPWMFRLATSPFVEGPLCSFHAAAVLVVGLAWSVPRQEPGRSSRAWLFAGVLAGGAMASKYPGLVSAVVPFGILVLADGWRKRSWRLSMAFGLGVAVAVGPWLARNVVDTGNPVYPLAFGVFGGAEWDETLDARWRNAHGPRPISAPLLASAVLDVAGRSDWHSPLFVLLAPLALLRTPGRRVAIILASYVLYLFATWFVLTHRLDRFWLPLLPAAAVLAGMGADWTRTRLWQGWLILVLVIGTATNLVFVTTPLCGSTDWTADLDRLRVSSIEESLPTLARLDAILPAGSRTLVIGQAGVFPLRHSIRYNTVFNRERFDAIVEGKTPIEIADQFHQQQISHVYVDWSEINRHLRPGGYGFSPVVTRTRFEDLVSSRVLSPPERVGPDHFLYRVLGSPESPLAQKEERSP